MPRSRYSGHFELTNVESLELLGVWEPENGGLDVQVNPSEASKSLAAWPSGRTSRHRRGGAPRNALGQTREVGGQRCQCLEDAKVQKYKTTIGQENDRTTCIDDIAKTGENSPRWANLAPQTGCMSWILSLYHPEHPERILNAVCGLRRQGWSQKRPWKNLELVESGIAARTRWH